MTRLEPDLSQTYRFLQALTGGTTGTFQFFSDRDDLKRVLPDGKLYDPNAHWKQGSLDTLALHLLRVNARGIGVHLMMNEGDGRGRSAENVQLVRALCVDTDGAPQPSGLPLKPHIIVQSSPGKWHLYWLVSGIDLSEFSTLQHALAKLYRCDTSIKDICRVMRVPGLDHCKGEPVRVELLKVNEHPRFTRAQVFAAWPELLQALGAKEAQEATQERERLEITRRAAERRANPTAATDDRRHAQRLLQAHHDTLAAAPDGTRNAALCRHAFTLGGYIAAGYLEPDEVGDVLLAAAVTAGLPEAEARALIPRAVQKGMAQPLELDTRPSSSPSFGAVDSFSAPNTAPKDTRLGQAKPHLGFSGSQFSSRPALGGKPCL